MGVTIKIPAVLRGFTDRAREVPGRGATVGELIANLEADHPGIGRHLVGEDGALGGSINLFVNDHNVRTLEGLDSPIHDGDTVAFVPSASGG